jgi:hypothetical protein
MSESTLVRRGALSAREAAEFLSTTEGTLAQWRHRGDGPPYVRMGRKIAYRVESLDAWLRDLEVPAIGGGRL